MTMNEQFSAFLDNEATCDESDAVVNALLRDEKLRGVWSRQHRVRDALRASPGDISVSVDVEFTSRVMQAVAAESTYAVDNVVAGRHNNIVSMPAKGQRRRRWRNMAGFAVAASAAGFAFFVTQPLQQFDTTMRVPASQQAATQPVSLASANAVDTAPGLSFETVASASTSGLADFDIPWNLAGGLAQSLTSRVNEAQDAVDHWSVSDPTLANRLNDFLVEHNGLARGYGLGATTPAFVRVATYGQDFLQ